MNVYIFECIYIDIFTTFYCFDIQDFYLTLSNSFQKFFIVAERRADQRRRIIS